MKSKQTLSQSSFPRLWTWFQIVAGGLHDKRALCLSHYRGQPRVLEVGCSAGTIAEAFRRYPNVAYTGIDVDDAVIRFVRRKFRGRKNFTFLCRDLRGLSLTEARFDYVLLAGVCHHVSDDDVQELVEAARAVLAPGADLIVVDPVLPEAGDPRLFSLYCRLDEGGHLRTNARLRDLLSAVPGLRITEGQTHVVGASPLSRPRCARFAVYRLHQDG